MLIEFKAICKELPTHYCNRLNQIYDCKIENGLFMWLCDSIEFGEYDTFSNDTETNFLKYFEILPSYKHLFIKELEYEIC